MNNPLEPTQPTHGNTKRWFFDEHLSVYWIEFTPQGVNKHYVCTANNYENARLIATANELLECAELMGHYMNYIKLGDPDKMMSVYANIVKLVPETLSRIKTRIA